jgi:hypothetical protein
LQWFFDHEQGGPDAVLTRKPPSARMRRLMAKEGDVSKLPIGQFDYQRWRLTDAGLKVLQAKPVPKPRGGKHDHSDRRRNTVGGAR